MAMDCATRLWGQCSYSNGVGHRKPAYQFHYKPLELPSDPGEGTCFKFFITVVDYLRNKIAQHDETDVGQKACPDSDVPFVLHRTLSFQYGS
jgi:hypothetical protein